MAMLNGEQLLQIGFKSLGNNVQISDKASFYKPENIELGSNVRIDDFCVLASGNGGINIGSNVHIATGSTIIGAEKITLADFSGLSSRVSIYSSSDDYSGESLTNPTVPEEFKKVFKSPVYIARHVIVGSGAVVLPGVTLNEGVAIGALSLVNKDCEAFYIYAGNPIRKIKPRSRDLIKLEELYLQKIRNNHS